MSLNSVCSPFGGLFAGSTSCGIGGVILSLTSLGCVLFGMQKGDDQKHHCLMRPGIRVNCQID